MARQGRPRKDIEVQKQQILDAFQKLVDKFGKNAEKKMNSIARLSVHDWYVDYVARKYKRKRTLYHAFKIQYTNEALLVHYGEEEMYNVHRASTEYIFINSFMQGWHGGAFGGPDHPKPGVPYWREPAPGPDVEPPYYAYWYRPAARSEAPYFTMRKQFKEYIDKLDKKFTSEVEHQIIPMIRRLYETYQILAEEEEEVN